MRLNVVLRRQHIGRMFKRNWLVQGQRVPQETGAEAELAAKNILVHDPKEVTKEERKRWNIEVVGYKPQPLKLDESHPNWHDKACHIIDDKNALVEGADQAQVLLKTIHIEGLPESYQVKSEINKNAKEMAKQIIIASQLFDAQQEKLPIVKDPLRPAWNFARDYGILHSRRMRLFTSRLIQMMNGFSVEDTGKSRISIDNALLATSISKDDDLIQLKLRGDTLVVCPELLPPAFKASTVDLNLPNISPLKSTISLPQTNLYEILNQYALKTGKSTLLPAPHTLFIHHDKSEVKNLYETEVTSTQIMARGLLKTFVAAASYAKQLHGDDVQDLKEPVVVQSVNTDGRFFQFGILQLNTLNLNGQDGIKNVWYCAEPTNLFESCSYDGGRPVLDGFNLDVINSLFTFYNK